MTEEIPKEVSAYMAAIARKSHPKSRAKRLAALAKSNGRPPAPTQQLEAGYRACLGGMSLSEAARDVSKTRYTRLKEYCQGRESGSIPAPEEK